MTEKQIQNLFNKYYNNSCSQEEIKLLEEFMDSYQHESVWKESIHGNSIDVRNRIIEQVLKGNATKRKPTFYSNPIWWYRAVASFSILFVVAFGIHSAFILPTADEHKKIQIVERSIPQGQKTEVHLSDGSIVYINSASTVSYPERFSGPTREISLDGEAFFDVAHNADKPFIVRTGKIETKVLGTSFNINTRSDQVQVTVSTGSVQVQHVDPEIKYKDLAILKPNQQLSFNKKDQSITVLDINTDEILAWTKKQLIFKNEPLNRVTQKLELWYDVEFTYSIEALKQCRFTGTFENEPLVAILNTLQDISNINYQLQDKQITLSGSGCQ